MTEIRLTIKGQPASKANRRKLVKNPRTGRVMFIKSAEARAYEASVKAQVARRRPLLTGPLRFEGIIYYKTNLPDLDASVLFDSLEGRIFKNDRQIVQVYLEKRKDKFNPRAEIKISELGNYSFEDFVGVEQFEG